MKNDGGSKVVSKVWLKGENSAVPWKIQGERDPSALMPWVSSTHSPQQPPPPPLPEDSPELPQNTPTLSQLPFHPAAQALRLIR